MSVVRQTEEATSGNQASRQQGFSKQHKQEHACITQELQLYSEKVLYFRYIDICGSLLIINKIRTLSDIINK